MSYMYVLEGQTPVPTDNAVEWGKWFKAADRHVGLDRLSEDIVVSTVFLGMDHSFGGCPPLLFETMIFGIEEDELLKDYQVRYCTWDEAVAGHALAVKFAKEYLE